MSSYESYYNSTELICTLYIRNLNEKVSKQKLRDSIVDLFNSHNLPIKNISIFKNLQLRGQAFVTLNTHADCLKAIDTLNTHVIFDKPMDIYFSKLNSDVGVQQVLKDQDPGNYQQKYEEYLKNKRPIRLESRSQANKKRGLDDDDSEGKKQRLNNNNSEPNKMLLFTQLPNQVTQEQLITLFERYNGFLTATLVGVRNLALIEFNSEIDSANCLNQLGHSVKLFDDLGESYLQFAKK